MNLVRRTFEKWNSRTRIVSENDTRAEERHSLSLASNIFATWRKQAVLCLDHTSQASKNYDQKLCSKSLALLRNHHASLQNLSDTAAVFQKESINIQATAYLRKIKWRLFQIQRGEENALALRQRTFEKHLRSMLRFWMEQTQERLALRVRDASPTPGKARDAADDPGDHPDLFEHEGDETVRLENWTAFDEGSLGLSDSHLDLSFSVPTRLQDNAGRPPKTAPAVPSSSRPTESHYGTTTGVSVGDLGPPQAASTPMPVPGYLKTPSKRSVARSSLHVAGRPVPRGAATAPVLGFADPNPSASTVTSFERRLREQGYAGRGRGRGRVVAFQDIDEERS
jgi:protein SFI1